MTSRKPRQPMKMQREFTVVYTMTACQGDCCTKEKTVLASGYVDASMAFQKKFPLAHVVRVRSA